MAGLGQFCVESLTGADLTGSGKELTLGRPKCYLVLLTDQSPQGQEASRIFSLVASRSPYPRFASLDLGRYPLPGVTVPTILNFLDGKYLHAYREPLIPEALTNYALNRACSA